MNIAEISQKRYSTKAFDPDRKIADDLIAQLKTLLQNSPSSVNSQPWHYVIASTAAGKDRFRKATQDGFAFNDAKVANASHVVAFCAKTSIDDAYIERLMAQEKADGRFATDEAEQMVRNGREYFINLHRHDLADAPEWMKNQVYLSIGTLLLGAATLGIDAVPIEGFDVAAFDAEFDLAAKGLTSVTLVALGYRASDDFNATLPKSRLPLSEIITEV
jgi:nitroreductase/dihydropteridine reductase